jgi:hypothetical protein
VVTDTADNNLESMPDITQLMKIYLPAPKKPEEISELLPFEDPNAMRTEDEARRNGGRYFDAALEGLGMQHPDRPIRMQEPKVFIFKPTPIIEQVQRPI